MKLNVVKTIEENIIKVNITVDELGTNSIDASEEMEQLHDFPKKIAYKDIEFKANMKLSNFQQKKKTNLKRNVLNFSLVIR